MSWGYPALEKEKPLTPPTLLLCYVAAETCICALHIFMRENKLSSHLLAQGVLLVFSDCRSHESLATFILIDIMSKARVSYAYQLPPNLLQLQNRDLRQHKFLLPMNYNPITQLQDIDLPV